MTSTPAEISLPVLRSGSFVESSNTHVETNREMIRYFVTKLAAFSLIFFNSVTVVDTLQTLSGKKVDSLLPSGVIYFNLLTLADLAVRSCSKHPNDRQPSCCERTQTIFIRAMKQLVLTLAASIAISGIVEMDAETFHRYTWITAAMVPTLFLLNEEHPLRGIPRNVLLMASAISSAILANHLFGNLDLDNNSKYGFLHAIIFPVLILNPALLIFPDVYCRKICLTRVPFSRPGRPGLPS